jgi:hypothetical protein
MFKSLFSSSSASSNKVNPLPIGQLRNAKFSSSLPPPSQSEEQKTAWLSIYLAALFTFMAAIQFTLFFTSLWPFMQILDPTVTVGFFGAVIAMYSLSQIVASPLMGIWTNRIGIFRPPLFVCQKPPIPVLYN